MAPRSLRVSPIAVGVSLIALAGPASAIPSPDVVVNFFSNAAHLLALGGAYLGGNALLRRIRRPDSSKGASPRLLLVLGVVLVVSLLSNFLQYRTYSDAKTRRLTLNLVRTSKQAGRLIKDENLKTLDFSEQIVHPFGLDNGELVARLGKPECPPVLDVREDEEYAQARLAGSNHVRYPDMLAEPEKYLKPGVRAVLFCWSGNRSAELVEALRPRGWDVLFVRGGYEKWRADGQPLEGWGAKHGDPRDIPDYPNRTRLLDTDDVLAAMQREPVVFLDNRYDAEFNAERLSDSVQICVRMLPSVELDRKIQALPKEPAYIGVVYDKRSGFFASVLGSKLAASGRKYLGRYTVPHELPPDTASLVKKEATLAAGSNFGLLAPLCAPLRSALLWFGERLGSIALGLLAAVLALRFLLLPLSVAAQRSAFRMNRAADGIQHARESFAADPRARSAALKAAQRQAGVRPGLSIVALLVQFVALMGMFRVVAGLEELQGAPLLRGWINDLSVPDPWFVLPALVGLATAALMAIGARRKGAGRWIVPGITGLVLAALVAPFRAAIPLYLAVSIGFAALEKAVVFAREARRGRERERGWGSGTDIAAISGTDEGGPDGFLPLLQAAHAPGVGAKARNLGILLERGFPVPEGFVAPCSFFGSNPPRPWRPTPDQEQSLRRAFRALGAPRVAVRSSALGEDGERSSCAGVFESVLDVDERGLVEAVALVVDSFGSERARAHGKRVEPCVLVQKMVEPDWSGVVFTTHPSDAGALLIEAKPGRGEDLVQGRVEPTQVVIDRESLEIEEGAAPFPVADLARLALRLEDLFGAPQDIEWAFAEGKIRLVQARPITVPPGPGSPSRWRAREAKTLQARASGRSADRPMLRATGLTEDLPRPTALSLDLMRALWGPGGAVERACREAGLPYNDHVDPSRVLAPAFGRLYVDPDEEGRLFAGRRTALSSWRIERVRRDAERRFGEETVPAIERYLRAESAVDLERLEDGALFDRLEARWRAFVGPHYAAAEIVNVLADYSHRVVERQLKGTGLSVAAFVHGRAPGAYARANALLESVAAGRATLAEYLDRFGHRAEIEYELSCPRFREALEVVDQLVGALRALRGRNGKAAAPASDGAEARAFVAALRGVRRRMFEENVAYLRSFETLKEEAKDLLLRELAVLRTTLLEVARRRGLGEHLFHLTFAEVLRLRDPSVRLEARAIARRSRREACADIDLPADVRPEDLNGILAGIAGPALEPSGEELRGMLVSGSRPVTGRVRVVRALADLEPFQPGEVLVAFATEPTWSVVFPRAAGVVTEVGGALSHTAILAREYGLTAVVAAHGATRLLRTGDLVRIEMDGRVIPMPGRSGQPEPARVDSTPSAQPTPARVFTTPPLPA